MSLVVLTTGVVASGETIVALSDTIVQVVPVTASTTATLAEEATIIPHIKVAVVLATLDAAKVTPSEALPITTVAVAVETPPADALPTSTRVPPAPPYTTMDSAAVRDASAALDAVQAPSVALDAAQAASADPLAVQAVSAVPPAAQAASAVEHLVVAAVSAAAVHLAEVAPVVVVAEDDNPDNPQ